MLHLRNISNNSNNSKVTHRKEDSNSRVSKANNLSSNSSRISNLSNNSNKPSKVFPISSNSNPEAVSKVSNLLLFKGILAA